LPSRRGVVHALVAMSLAAVGVSCARSASMSSASTATRESAHLSPGDIAHLAALLAAADARRPDTAVIDDALTSSSPFVRAYAARTIGQNGMLAQSGVVRALLSDADSAVAADAAFALGLMRDTAATEALAATLARSRSAAEAAAWSLGEMGNAGRPIIEHALAAGQPRSAIAAILRAAAKLRPVPAALVIPYLQDADIAVAEGAAYAVTRSRVPASVRALLALETRLTSLRGSSDANDDPAVDLRSYIARGLGQPAAGDSLASESVAALGRLARDRHPHVRINALRSLASYGAAARDALKPHLHDSDANVRIALAQSLGDVFGKRAGDWNEAWAADSGFTFRRAVLTSALRVGVRLAALDPASGDAWQRHRDWRYRVAAAQAAGGGAIVDVDAIAAPLLGDPDARVRNAAYGAALTWSDSASAIGKAYGRSALVQALADPDLFVRATILDALRSRARAADASAALRAWRAAANDPESDARVAAARVIAAAWAQDSASFGASLRDSLGAMAAPSDPIERAAGKVAGPLRHWAAEDSRPLHPMAWYADQVRRFIVPATEGRPTRATIVTPRGTIQLRLFGADAPLTVANFVVLARRHYYDGLVFHRVVPNFVAQDGDPRGDGSGGPGYAIRDELNRRWYDRGAVGMALSGPDTGGSQYFLAHSPQPHLDGHYTVFGHVIAGFDVLDAIVQGDRISSIAIQ
jgi:cyclophilin family peptidyl-prolyl cis-trans isomerase/HEAT repeat protein